MHETVGRHIGMLSCENTSLISLLCISIVIITSVSITTENVGMCVHNCSVKEEVQEML